MAAPKNRLTPKERNRIRHARDLLDFYEQSPSMRDSVIVNLSTCLSELHDAHIEASEAHRAEQDARSSEALASLGKKGEND